MQDTMDDANIVFSLMQDHQWERALKEAKRAPKLVRNLFRVSGFYDGQIHSRVNALHMASALGAPAKVVTALAAIHPAGTIEGDSKYGRVPLLVAAMAGVSVETVTALLKVNPAACEKVDYNKRIALHYACKSPNYGEGVVRLLLRAFPEGAMVADDCGFLPLHVACRYATSPSTVRMLIRAAPSSIDCKTHKGSTPVMCAKTNRDSSGNEIVALVERSASEVSRRSSDASSISSSLRLLERFDSNRAGFTTALQNQSVVS
eukprot:Nitzschia sp. Nitz4//scaffold7_size249615//161939//162721//NITZ4_001188-RA/size249615-processed-gene-0.148-mRNA-1//1//CDS//3329558475//4769//frame0